MKSIIAGVGQAMGFDSQGNMIFKSYAETDSGFNISTNKEEIRGGAGASLHGQYFHTTQFGVNLKDALFDLNYLALQVGGAIKQGGDMFVTEQVIVGEGNDITVKGTPKEFGGYGTIGWFSHMGKEEMNTVKFIGKNAKTSGIKQGDVLCVTYVQTDDSARVFEVATNYIPSEIHLVFDMPLFKASAMTKEGAKTESKIGSITVDVPRFQFDGNVDLATAMASSTGVNISGVALQTNVTTCSGQGVYATVTENIYGRDEFENIKAIVVEDSDLELAPREKQTLTVMAIYNDGTSMKVLDNKKLTFTVASGGQSFASVGANDGVVSATSTGTATIEIKVTEKPELEATARVTVSE